MALDIRRTVRARGLRDGIRRLRADDGIRTRDPHLGKVMLYQLSHVRVPSPRRGEAAQAGRGRHAFRTVADPVRAANSVGSIRRRSAGSCLDWTQRRPHLSGALGAAITARLLELGWIERGPARRAVRVTPAGQDGLAETFGWPPEPDGP